MFRVMSYRVAPPHFVSFCFCIPRACQPPGPGRGIGGAPGQPGENCEPLRNVLIIQEEDKEAPDDNLGGGRICFEFTTPTDVKSVGLLDIPPNRGDFVQIETAGTLAPQSIVFQGLGITMQFRRFRSIPMA